MKTEKEIIERIVKLKKLWDEYPKISRRKRERDRIMQGILDLKWVVD